jgi:hypothetical protein
MARRLLTVVLILSAMGPAVRPVTVRASEPLAGTCAMKGTIMFTPALTTTLQSGLTVNVLVDQVACTGLPSGFTVQVSLAAAVTANCALSMPAGTAGSVTFSGGVEAVSGSYVQGPGAVATVLLNGNLGFQASLDLAWDDAPCPLGGLSNASATGVMVFSAA